MGISMWSMSLGLAALACASALPTWGLAQESLTGAERARLAERERQGSTAVLDVEAPQDRALLESPSRPISPATVEIPRLIAQMEQTVRARRGWGIAAVQLGIPVRLVLLQRRDDRGEQRFQAFLNPVLTQMSPERSVSWENCLSVPWGFRYVDRAGEVRVRYQTAAGEERQEDLRDDEAAVFQQEMDHLDGQLLSSGYGHSWFIPPEQMGRFMADIRRLCREKSDAECLLLSRQHWEERAHGRSHH